MFGDMRLPRDVSPWCRKRLAPVNHAESEVVSNKCSFSAKVVWRNLWLPSNNFLVHQGCTNYSRLHEIYITSIVARAQQK